MQSMNLSILVLVMLTLPSTSFLYSTSKFSSNTKCVTKVPLKMGVEHLVNCLDSDLVKFSDMCLDTNKDHITQTLFVDLFEKVVNIGLLIASYFYFKRLATVSDPSIKSTSDNDSREFTNYETYESRECPKCNGSGRSLVNRGQACSLCGGVGELELPPVQSLKLPRPRDTER